MFGQRKLHLIFCILLGFSISANTQTLKFAKTSISNIKKASKNLNKPFFVYISATDSPDCRLMEATTFKDPAIVNLINSNLLALELPMESEAGEKLIKKQKIRLMPAILFYNTKGKLVLQQESTIESSAFLKILELLYDIKAPSTEINKEEKVVAAQIELPQQSQKEAQDSLNQKTEVDTVVSKISLPRKTIKIKANDIPELNNDILKEVKKNKLKSPDKLFGQSADQSQIKIKALNQTSIRTQTLSDMDENPKMTLPWEEPSKDQVITSKGTGTNEGLGVNLVETDSNVLAYRFAMDSYLRTNKLNIQELEIKERKRKVLPQPALVNHVVTKTIIHEKKNLSPPETKRKARKSPVISHKKNRLVQLGAYIKYDDVLKSMYRLKRKMKIPLTILEEVTNGKKLYKLVTSEIMTLSDANSLSLELKQSKIDCFVRKVN